MSTNDDISVKEYYRGRTFCGRIVSFEMDECEGAGAGSNGDVFKIKTKYPDGKLVAKFLKPKYFSHDNHTNLIRKQRFIVECQRTKAINAQLHNKKVIPIIDSCNMDDTKDADALWYIMPKAELLFERLKNHKPVEKIKYMISLGESIVAMHEIGYQHRDIKPKNILFYNGEVYLGDLGLVFDEKDPKNNVESFNEAVGPLYYRPPELDKYVKDKISLDMKAVDVYEFAKTVWAFLTENGDSFQGKYDKTVYPRVALSEVTIKNFDKTRILTLEDLHTFLTQATDNIASRRPTIQECIEMLKNWLKNYDDAKVASQQMIQSVGRELPKNYLPGQMVYFNNDSNINALVDIIKSYKSCLNIDLPKVGECVVMDVSIPIQGYMKLGLLFRQQTFSIIFKPKRIIINNNANDSKPNDEAPKVCIIETEDVHNDPNDFSAFTDLLTLSILPGDFFIDTSKGYIIKDIVVLNFEPKSTQELFGGR
jgi:serine/threonine protein kinase